MIDDLKYMLSDMPLVVIVLMLVFVVFLITSLGVVNSMIAIVSISLLFGIAKLIHNWANK